MKQIIGIVGSNVYGEFGSGKDTVANHIMQIDKRFIKLAYAEPIRDIAKIMFGFSDSDISDRKLKETKKGILDYTPRKAMITIGTDLVCKNIHPDFWVIHLENRIAHHKYIIISDLRHPNEAAQIRRLGGIIIRVERSPSDPTFSDGIDADYIIKNNSSISDLRRKVECLMELLSIK